MNEAVQKPYKALHIELVLVDVVYAFVIGNWPWRNVTTVHPHPDGRKAIIKWFGPFQFKITHPKLSVWMPDNRDS